MSSYEQNENLLCLFLLLQDCSQEALSTLGSQQKCNINFTFLVFLRHTFEVVSMITKVVQGSFVK